MKNLSTIQKLGNRVHIFLTICIAVIPLYYLSFWLLQDQYPIYSDVENCVDVVVNLSLQMKLLGLIASLFPMLALCSVFMYLRQLFAMYKEGVLFTFKHVVLFKKISKSLIAWVIFSIAYEACESVIFSWNNPLGERMLTVGFDTEQLTLLIIAGFVYAIAWVMDEGRVLTEENQMTI